MDATNITPPHAVKDEEKLVALVNAMRSGGWQGRPLLVAETPWGVLGLTGSHRTAAARIAEIDAPVLSLSAAAWELVEAQGLDMTQPFSQDAVHWALDGAYQDAEPESAIEAELDAALELFREEEG